jgi:hypothetical protein
VAVNLAEVALEDSTETPADLGKRRNPRGTQPVAYVCLVLDHSQTLHYQDCAP